MAIRNFICNHSQNAKNFRTVCAVYTYTLHLALLCAQHRPVMARTSRHLYDFVLYSTIMHDADSSTIIPCVSHIDHKIPPMPYTKLIPNTQQTLKRKRAQPIDGNRAARTHPKGRDAANNEHILGPLRCRVAEGVNVYAMM